MLNLAEIWKVLAAYEPTLVEVPGGPAMQAAVALILHEAPGGDPELLYIERAQVEHDPWSGQMAFPGGRQESRDADLQATAARETLEETGIRLSQPIGRIDDTTGGKAPDWQIVVSTFAYELAERPRLRLNREVSSAVWVPLSWILNPESAAQYRFERAGFHGSYPAFRYRRYTVWGLTYRILERFVGILGRSLPSYQRREPGDQESD